MSGSKCGFPVKTSGSSIIHRSDHPAKISIVDIGPSAGRQKRPFLQSTPAKEQIMLNRIDCFPDASTAALVKARALPVLDPIKARQQAAWASGDFAIIGSTLQIVGEDLCEALDLRAGQRVLDVAAGNGNAALAAARRWCEVTASDYVPALLDRAKERAFAERLPIETEIADAEDLPYADDSFDVVTSTFGAMFTPNHEKPAREMLRVCRPHGKIGLANWTPDGFIGQLFKTIGAYVPPPANLKSPALWGTKAHLEELFGGNASSIEATTKDFMFRYRSDDHWIKIFRTYYGPVYKTFEIIDLETAAALMADLKTLIAKFNVALDGTMVVPAEYLQAVIVKR
jgi:ubiquinone/menaquinone biosynthesis C-methylase UbiE